MTAGHKHRHVRVRRHWLITRVLRHPLFVTENLDRVDRSPYPYGPMISPKDHHDVWYLSALGILHRWTGLTLVTTDPPEEE